MPMPYHAWMCSAVNSQSLKLVTTSGSILFEEFHAMFNLPHVTSQYNCRTRMSALRAAPVLLCFRRRPSGEIMVLFCTTRWRQTIMADPSVVLLDRYTCSASAFLGMCTVNFASTHNECHILATKYIVHGSGNQNHSKV